MKFQLMSSLCWQWPNEASCFDNTHFKLAMTNVKLKTKVQVFMPTKVVPIIKCTCIVFIDNFRKISTNSSIYVSVCRGSYAGCVKHKRNDPMCDPSDSQWNEKVQSLLLLLFALTF